MCVWNSESAALKDLLVCRDWQFCGQWRHIIGNQWCNRRDAVYPAEAIGSALHFDMPSSQSTGELIVDQGRVGQGEIIVDAPPPVDRPIDSRPPCEKCGALRKYDRGIYELVPPEKIRELTKQGWEIVQFFPQGSKPFVLLVKGYDAEVSALEKGIEYLDLEKQRARRELAEERFRMEELKREAEKLRPEIAKLREQNTELATRGQKLEIGLVKVRQAIGDLRWNEILKGSPVE